MPLGLPVETVNWSTSVNLHYQHTPIEWHSPLSVVVILYAVILIWVSEYILLASCFVLSIIISSSSCSTPIEVQCILPHHLYLYCNHKLYLNFSNSSTCYIKQYFLWLLVLLIAKNFTWFGAYIFPIYDCSVKNPILFAASFHVPSVLLDNLIYAQMFQK